jgi:hypothetical protein
MSDTAMIPPSLQTHNILPYTSSLSFSQLIPGFPGRPMAVPIMSQGAYSMVPHVVLNPIQRPLVRFVPMQQQQPSVTQKEKDENM